MLTKWETKIGISKSFSLPFQMPPVAVKAINSDDVCKRFIRETDAQMFWLRETYDTLHKSIVDFTAKKFLTFHNLSVHRFFSMKRQLSKFHFCWRAKVQSRKKLRFTMIVLIFSDRDEEFFPFWLISAKFKITWAYGCNSILLSTQHVLLPKVGIFCLTVIHIRAKVWLAVKIIVK